MKKIVLMLSVSGSLFFSNAADANCSIEPWASSSFICKQSGFDTSGEPASCGEGCSYTYNNGTVTITATQNYGNATLSGNFFAQGYWEGNKFRDTNGNIITVNGFMIDGFSSFGGDAFFYSNTDIKGKDGTLILDKVGGHAFVGATLSGNIIWQGHMNDAGFKHTLTINGNLIVEDTATVDKYTEGNGISLGANGKVFCKTDMDKCLKLLEKAGASNNVIAAAEKFPEGCKTLSLDADCSECENENFSLEYGYCYRKRYTIPEADAATSDDYENMIEWIFE